MEGLTGLATELRQLQQDIKKMHEADEIEPRETTAEVQEMKKSLFYVPLVQRVYYEKSPACLMIREDKRKEILRPQYLELPNINDADTFHNRTPDISWPSFHCHHSVVITAVILHLCQCRQLHRSNKGG